MLESRCQGKVDGTVLLNSSILMNEISENTSTEELNKLFLVKFQFSENYTLLSITWRSRICMARRNSECASIESQRELESYERPINGQIKTQRERIHLFSELEMKNRLHRESDATSCREIEELKRRCYQEENAVRRRKLEEFPTQHGQESRTLSLLQDQVRSNIRQKKFHIMYMS